MWNGFKGLLKHDSSNTELKKESTEKRGALDDLDELNKYLLRKNEDLLKRVAV